MFAAHFGLAVFVHGHLLKMIKEKMALYDSSGD